MRITSTGNVGIGTSFVIPQYFVGSQTGGVLQVATNVAKTATSNSYPVGFFGSNDATYPLGLYIGILTGSTTGTRQVKLQGTEIGLSANNIVMQQDGGNVLINTINDNGQKVQISGGLSISNLGASSNVIVGSDNSGILSKITVSTGLSLNSGVLTATGQAQLNGTGFVKATGTTISYDNSTYLTTSSASSTYVPYSGANASVNLGSYTITAGAFYESSDIRFKNVLETNPSISALGIDVIKFTRKGQSQVRYGYSAQQVKSILPDAVFGYDELTVNYSDVHTIKIASLEKRVAELESRLKSTI
jgi:hypothetical protein